MGGAKERYRPRDKPRHIHPIAGGATDNALDPASSQEDARVLTPREFALAEWRDAPTTLKEYPGGVVTDSSGAVLYEYASGARLMILGHEVMDSCQLSWADTTVDKAFEALGNKRNVAVLERGFGMGIVATRIMQHLQIRGGTYTTIELNREVAAYADTTWRGKQNALDLTRATSVPGGIYTGSNVTINIIEGDAYEQTAILAEEKGEFDFIASDTFPLTDGERSLNDLLDLETLKRCLAPGGVFTFFGYFTGSEGGIASHQRDIIAKHFEYYAVVGNVMVYPPPEYEYFNPPSGPIRRLPIIICKNPIFES